MTEKFKCILDGEKECPEECTLHAAWYNAMNLYAEISGITVEEVVRHMNMINADDVKGIKLKFLQKFPFETIMCVNHNDGKKM